MDNGYERGQGPTEAGPSRFPQNPPTQSFTNHSTVPRTETEDGLLGVGSRWSEDAAGGDRIRAGAGNRMSRLVGMKAGLSPPPPPGPPPSAPPPLPPLVGNLGGGITTNAGNHPFRAGQAGGRLSSVGGYRKGSASSSRPITPPPPQVLPPIQTQALATTSTVPSTTTTPTHVRHTSIASISSQSSQISQSPPISPRISSLLDSPRPRNIPRRAGAGAGEGERQTRTPSRHLLQTALDLAQRAVEMDKNNNVAGALAAYREAVERLKSVMERVGVEPGREDGRSRRNLGKNEEEGRTLRGIHDAYVARIQLLSSFENGESVTASDSPRSLQPQHATTSTATLVPISRSPVSDIQSGGRTPRPSIEEAVYGIGTLMLNEADSSFDSSARSRPAQARHSYQSVSPRRSSLMNYIPPIDSPGDATRNSSLSLQQALDQVGMAQPVIPPPRRESITAASIGLGYPSSPPLVSGSPPSRRKGRPSVGLETELHLDGADGDGMETLSQTPLDSVSPTPQRRLSNSMSGSMYQQPSSPGSSRLSSGPIFTRPLPPVPHSAPILDGTGQPVLLPRKASLQVTPGSLVNDSTNQGTISQRRQSKLPAVESTIPFPGSPESNSSVQSPSSSAMRTRARSQPGQRAPEGDVPPLPPPGVRKKTSFPPNQRAGSHLRVQTDTSSLAPPVSLYSHSAASTTRSLPPLPDTAAYPSSGNLISPLPESQPADHIHRPFHLLRILYASMDPESSGSYLTGAIHISSAVWKASNWTKSSSNSNGPAGKGREALAPPKILAQDVKVRVIEALLLHFEVIRQVGAALLDGPRNARYGPTSGSQPPPRQGDRYVSTKAEELVHAFEGLEEEMEASYKVLVKSGVGFGSWKGKKSGNAMSWGSRITKTMDKMTNGKALDSPDKYVDLLSTLCYNAQVINEHLLCFTGPCTPAYHSLSDKAYRHLEGRVIRAAEFVGGVVVPFVLDDFKQFLLRYLNGGMRYLEE